MATYNGWSIVTMPTTPPAPASFEFALDSVTGVTTNPFSGQQQIQDWSASWLEASVSYASMHAAAANAWYWFLLSCKGPACVFTFPTAVCAQFPNELTTDGTTPRYWRLKGNQTKWGVKVGGFYSITFEIREAL
jgi:hypothetical protein